MGTIPEYDNALDLNLAREVAPYFRFSESDREKVIDKIQKEVSQWATIVKKT